MATAARAFDDRRPQPLSLEREPGAGTGVHRALLAAALTVMSGFMASKVLGLVRSIVVGAQYGATREYETFLAAIGVTDTVFQVLAGGSVGAAFIPVFAGYLARGEKDLAWRLVSALLNWAILAAGLIALALALAAPLLMQVLVPGWSREEQAEAAYLTRILLMAPVIFSASALVTSALNGVQRFALAALAPLAYNAALIFGATVLRPWETEGLAYSAVLGALLHLLVQLPGLRRVGMQFSLTLGRDLAGTREVVRLMGPRVVSLGISQINQLANVVFASFLVAGSIAYLNYAWMILMAPLGVFAMGFSTAVFPTLAAQNAAGQTAAQQRTFWFGLRLILFGTLPAAMILATLSLPIVSLLLERGAFSSAQADATAAALALYAIGLPGHSVIEIVNRVFYAEHDTATPVKAAGIALAVNLALSVVLMNTPLSYGGLALANSLAAFAEAGLLLLALHRRGGWLSAADVASFVARLTLAAAVLGLVIMGLQLIAAEIDGPRGWVRYAVIAVATSVVGGAAYITVAAITGTGEVARLRDLLRRQRF